MTWLTEDPTIIVILVALVEAVLLLVLLATRLMKVLAAMGAVAAVAALLLLVEWLIQTDRETVHATLQRMVANVKSGEVEAVTRDISNRPEGRGLRALVRQYLPSVRIERVAIKKLQIAIDTPPPPNLLAPVGAAQPPAPLERWARVELSVFGTMESRGVKSAFDEDLTLIFAPEQGRWPLVSFENYEGFGRDLLRGTGAREL